MTEHHETPSQVVHRVTYSLQRWGLSPGPNVPGNFTRPPVALGAKSLGRWITMYRGAAVEGLPLSTTIDVDVPAQDQLARVFK